ncbi:MAG: c-type cytochrome [Flavobacteriales bacterium]|mgnify:CR=1 FL=1|jgi:cytochrome c peroxidase|nr:c-type cytochrome [Flavobacteriales bacterium]
MKKLLLISVIASLFTACKKETIIRNIFNTTPFVIETPYGFPEIILETDNPLTKEGVFLGKILYSDNILSTNGNSCSTCHLQEYAYSVPGNGPTGNNVMPHFNLAWKKNYGWTGAEQILENVDLGDLEDGNPFLNNNGVLGQNDSILARFKRHPQYRDLFQKAFDVNIIKVTENVRKQYISYALSQFMRTLITANSKIDKYLRGELQLTPSELNGYAIFNSEKGDCFHCHGTAMYTDHYFHNNGINAMHLGINKGRYLVTNDVDDMGKFYSPSLRNIELTAPYMHDGRFATLEEVVDHYNSGGIYSSTIDPLMKKVGVGLQLTNQEEKDLVAFLKTLTDNEFIGNIY